jgi:RNA polymerase-binding transcription factor DksA
MARSKRSKRYAILNKLYDHLQEQYSISWSRETFVDGQFSIHQIDAILAFKSDPHLDELRSALDRLESGTYGICLSCKAPISEELLDADPSQRFCAKCEETFSHALAPSYGIPVSL